MTSFQFTITDGSVTGIAVTHGDRTQTLRIPTDATFAIGSGTITETITGARGVQTLTFTQSATDSATYTLASSTLTITSPSVAVANGVERGYGFTIADGVVTAVREEVTVGSNSRAHDLKISSTDSFTVADGEITETRLHDNVVETITYVKPEGATLYAVASVRSIYIDAGSATTHLSIHDQARISATVSDGSVSAVQAISPSGAATALTTNRDVVFWQPESGFIIETITRGSRANYEVFYDGGGDGVYTSVAHGVGATIDLVGLKAQLDQLDSALIALL